MAINLKSSIGTSTANSYVSLASANSYYQVRINSDAWTNIESSTSSTGAYNDKKRALLIQATRELDRTFRFHGGKYNVGIRGSSDYQALEFPRANDYESDGTIYIEEDVKYAVYEQALWILQRTNARQAEGETVINRQLIGKDSYNYLRPYINQQVTPSGNHPWQ